MRKIIVAGIGMIAISVLLFTSCKKNKDDPKELNTITITGSTYIGLDGEYIPSEGFFDGSYLHDNCKPIIYEISFEVECEDRTDFGFSIFTLTELTEIPTGTFNVAGDCETGFTLSVQPKPRKGSKALDLSVESGTLKINKEGDVYDVDIDGVIRSDSGGGKIKGNFSGPIMTDVK